MTTHTTISTHVLDTSLGAPAADIPVTLVKVGDVGVVTMIASGVTNADGRVPSLVSAEDALGVGTYRLCFDVAGYFASQMRQCFYAEICIAFVVSRTPQHYHVPLLLSPYGYSTYRGS